MLHVVNQPTRAIEHLVVDRELGHCNEDEGKDRWNVKSVGGALVDPVDRQRQPKEESIRKTIAQECESTAYPHDTPEEIGNT